MLQFVGPSAAYFSAAVLMLLVVFIAAGLAAPRREPGFSGRAG
jgi:hypothetical protein